MGERKGKEGSDIGSNQIDENMGIGDCRGRVNAMSLTWVSIRYWALRGESKNGGI